MRSRSSGSEAAVVLEVVVEAVLDDRTDGHLGFGEEALDRLRHEVSGRVAEKFESARILARDRRERAVGRERAEDVGELAVDESTDDTTRLLRIAAEGCGQRVPHGRAARQPNRAPAGYVYSDVGRHSFQSGRKIEAYVRNGATGGSVMKPVACVDGRCRPPVRMPITSRAASSSVKFLSMRDRLGPW